MRGWPRRISVTLGILFLYELGAHVPLPGLGIDSLLRGEAGAPFFEGRRHSVMALGLMPYLSAAAFLMLLSGLFAPLRRLREGDAAQRGRFELALVVLTLVLGLLQGVGLARAYGSDAGALALIATTLGAASLLVVGLARIVTRWGLMNGVALILLAAESRRALHGLPREMRAPLLPAPQSRHWLGLILFTLLVIALLAAWLRARRRLVLVDAAGNTIHKAALRPSLTGALPLAATAGIIGTAGTLVPALRGFFWQPGPGAWAWIVRLALIALVNLLLTAWLFHPGDLRRRAARWGLRPAGDPDERDFDRLLMRWFWPHTLLLWALALTPLLVPRIANLRPETTLLYGSGLLVITALILEAWRLIRARAEDDAQAMAVILSSRVRLEPEIARAWLARAGIAARIEDSRCIGVTGSKGPWEASAPRFPAFFNYPYLGGGEVRLLVAADRLDAARAELKRRSGTATS